MRKLTNLLYASACLLTPGVAQAHVALGPEQRHTPYAALPLLLLALAYARGQRRNAPWPRISFLLGFFLTWLATLSPVAAVSERLFSTHMAQHLVLMLICAPLLVAAQTTKAAARALAPALERTPLRRLVALAGLPLTPVVIWLAFTCLFVIWHLPGLYAAALRDETVHALEHASFFLSAYAFWSVVMAPQSRRTLGYGARLFFIVSAALISGLPGALIALSSRPLYAIDPQAAARLGLTPLEDQQLAGLVMWIPGGFAYIAAALALLLAWLRQSESLTRRRQRGDGRALFAVALLSLTLAACDETAPQIRGAQANPVTGGDPRKGAEAIAAIGCGACHTIPGVNGAVGLVGPPLDRMGRRIYIAGLLRNTPENMEAWLQDPQKIVPGGVMPDMGISAEQSRDISAYLYTLR